MKNNYFPVGKIQSALESAYVAAVKAVRLVNKLKRNTPARKSRVKKQKSRVWANFNRIRNELKKFAKLNWPLFDTLAYSGVVIQLLQKTIIHSRFLRAA